MSRTLLMRFSVDDAYTGTDEQLCDIAEAIVTEVVPDPPVLTWEGPTVEHEPQPSPLSPAEARNRRSWQVWVDGPGVHTRQAYRETQPDAWELADLMNARADREKTGMRYTVHPPQEPQS